jgi:hypothetical protein
MPTGIIGNLKGRIEGLVHDWHSNDDEFFYGIVAEELEQDNIQKGLWLKAMSKTDMNEDKAKALYIKMRIAAVRKTILELAKARGITGELLSEITKKTNELVATEKQEAHLKKVAAGIAEEHSSTKASLAEAQANVETLRPEYEKETRKKNYRYFAYSVLSYLVMIAVVPVLAYAFDLPKSRILAEEIGTAGFWIFNLSNPYFALIGMIGFVIAIILSASLASTAKYQEISTRFSAAAGVKNKAAFRVVDLDYQMAVTSRKAKETSREKLLVSGDLDKLQTTLDDALAF